MATADRVLAVLSLYTFDEPEWTVDDIANRLGLSSSTAYLYVRSLVDAGLLVAGTAGRYAVGPAVISLDRLIRRHDVLVAQAKDAMPRLVAQLAGRSVALLCRSFRFKVMCVDQYSETPLRSAIGYERGLPMPLLRGAASKAILAHLPVRALRRFWQENGSAIDRAGLGADWATFKLEMRKLRAQPAVITRGEIDTGMVGISAAVFGSTGDVLGSIGVVVEESRTDRDDLPDVRIADLVRREAALITARLQSI